MGKKISSADEYLTGLAKSTKLVLLDRGMVFEVQRLPDEAVLKFFKASGRKPGEKKISKKTFFERMSAEEISAVLEVIVPEGCKNPRVTLKKSEAKNGVLHYDDILFSDKLTLMAGILDCTGIGEDADKARKDFQRPP